MARAGRFRPSVTGYREVMNSHNDVMTACEIKAGAIGASASRQSGLSYVVDAQTGLNRVHARVSTDGTKAAFYRERHYHALAIATSAMGGRSSYERGGYKTLPSRVRSVRNKSDRGWKAPGYHRKSR